MPNYRCHIHVACVVDDLLLHAAQDDIAIFFEGRAFLTKDLFINRPQSANYSWRCVNACDALLLLIGSSYGKTNISGVSQLHLSYSNAKTKNKPIFVFIHSSLLNPFNDNQRLREFVKLIESQSVESIWYFDDDTDLFSLLNETMGRLLVFDEPKLSSLSRSLACLPKPQSFKSFQPSAVPTVVLDLDNEFLVNCTAHVFKGGTLIEAAFALPMTWRQIISALSILDVPLSDQRLSRILTDLMDKKQADGIIMALHPNAHAVSRYQVAKTEVIWIKKRLHQYLQAKLSSV